MNLGLLMLLFACRTDGNKQPGTTSHDYDGDGFTEEDGDCNDQSSTVYPDAEELCDELDNDCNGEVDEGVGLLYFVDRDEDGFGDAADAGTFSCEVIEGGILNNEDCDDSKAEINPSADEECDEIDNNCNSEIDEGVTVRHYLDADRDGFGDPDVVEDVFADCLDLLHGQH